MLWESCSSSHTEHNKIGFAIFGFFCELIWILQGAAETHKGVKILITSRPLEDLKAHNHTLGLRQDPWEFLGPCNAVLKPVRRRNSLDSGEAAAEEGRWRGGGRWVTQPRLIGGRKRDQAAPARGVRRSHDSADAAAELLVKGQHDRGK
jgi:hypothetical protein